MEEGATGIAHLPLLVRIIELDRGGPPHGEPANRAEFDGLGVEAESFATLGEGQDVGCPERSFCV